MSNACGPAARRDLPREQEAQRASANALASIVSACSTAGASLAAVTAIVVFRYLPHEATHETAVESVEHMADLGVGGTLPLFVDENVAHLG